MMKRIFLLGSTIMLTVCLCSLPATAGTIFDDFGPNNGYNCCVGWTVSGAASPVGQFIAANEFTAGLSGAVNEIDIALALITGTGNATVSLYTVGNTGLPDVLLGSWAVTAHNDVETILVSNGPDLASGTEYFMVLQADDVTWDAWDWNITGATGIDLFSTDNMNSWTNNGIQTLGAFRVLGQPTGVPEPGTLIMLGSGVLAAAGVIRRKFNA